MESPPRYNATPTQTYEVNYQRLQQISKQLTEDQTLTLDQIEALYDEAQKCHQACEARITALQRKIAGD
ncbi:MAG: exodeoxyribonuclease VII small subunit [Hahellaceae bacterium]|nr:exodeoxyribonuclease VII small subunit [Hahellaceae bacterium]